MSGFVCGCASERCQVFGCQRMRQMLDEEKRRAVAERPMVNSCNCVGPQNGLPRCPCAMCGVILRNGRWIQKEVDLWQALLAGDPTKGAA